MAEVVIFGTGSLARLARHSIDAAGTHTVVAHCLDEEHYADSVFEGLPVLHFETLPQARPPHDTMLLVAIGYRRVNRGRAEVYARAKHLGYGLLTHVAPRAVVAAGVELGDNCIVLDGAIVEPFVRIGDDTVIWSGAYIGHDSTVGDHCFIAPTASISGDVTLGDYVFVGNNATIRDGVAIADRTVIGAGAVVKHDTRPGEVLSASETRASPNRDSSELDDL